MAAMTAEPRWRALFTIQAARLLGDLEETDNGPLWTQDLYGRHLRYVGPVHGYAGDMIALMRGWEWLTEDQRTQIAEAGGRSPQTRSVPSTVQHGLALWQIATNPPQTATTTPVLASGFASTVTELPGW